MSNRIRLTIVLSLLFAGFAANAPAQCVLPCTPTWQATSENDQCFSSPGWLCKAVYYTVSWPDGYRTYPSNSGTGQYGYEQECHEASACFVSTSTTPTECWPQFYAPETGYGSWQQTVIDQTKSEITDLCEDGDGKAYCGVQYVASYSCVIGSRRTVSSTRTCY